MNNKVSPANEAGKEEQSKITEQITELSEDMEMVSPGAMLREARKALSLSQEHIASKLNFKVGIVKNIEDDTLDPLMPVTFNRGYLVNYAKLVGVEVEDVLASYDALDAATIQRTEMLSFSKETAKQAEHSRVMWLSYFIVAVLVGLTILWWQQESRQQDNNSSNVVPSITVIKDERDNVGVKTTVSGALNEQKTDNSAQINENKSEAVLDIAAESDVITSKSIIQSNSRDISINVGKANINESTNALVNDVSPSEIVVLSTAIFTFSGDCWVNIFDATGERIAWGVKKSGYVMTIQGKAPLRITVGKPELTSIVFNGQQVDMSTFNVGNIAKFNLPLVE
jgi:cytoskeleton protein RodZ